MIPGITVNTWTIRDVVTIAHNAHWNWSSRRSKIHPKLRHGAELGPADIDSGQDPSELVPDSQAPGGLTLRLRFFAFSAWKWSKASSSNSSSVRDPYTSSAWAAKPGRKSSAKSSLDASLARSSAVQQGARRSKKDVHDAASHGTIRWGALGCDDVGHCSTYDCPMSALNRWIRFACIISFPGTFGRWSSDCLLGSIREC